MNRNFLPKANALLAIMLALLYVVWWFAAGAVASALNLTMLVFAALPLLLLSKGLWSGRRFVTALTGLIIPLHFAFAVMELIANPDVRGWVAMQTFLAFLLFAGIMTTLRQVGERV